MTSVDELPHKICFDNTNGSLWQDPYQGYGGRLVQASDGNVYGTTPRGGRGGWGTIFRMTPGGVMMILHSFSSASPANIEGCIPRGPPVQGTDGNFYGATESGGAYGYGTIYRISSDGVLSTLFSFDGINSGWNAPLVGTRGTDGNLYGPTWEGGGGDFFNGGGTIFQLSPGGVATVLDASSATVTLG